MRWNIENFLDYSACCIESLQSKEVFFEHSNASWFLEIYPKSAKSNEDLKISLTINDDELPGRRLFRAEISIDAEGHLQQSSGNRNMAHRQGFYARPEFSESPSWVLEYQANLQKAYENENFMTQSNLINILNGGTLTINCKVRKPLRNCYNYFNFFKLFFQVDIKSVEIITEAKKTY